MTTVSDIFVRDALDLSPIYLLSCILMVLASPVSTLAEGQKALAQYANDAHPEQFLSSTPLSPTEKQKLIEQYVSSPQGKQELEKRLKKQEKAQRQPIIWQIPEEKMNELKWQRTQLLRIQRVQAAKQNPNSQAAKKPVPKVTQGPVKKVGPPKQVSESNSIEGIKTSQSSIAFFWTTSPCLSVLNGG